MDGLQDKVFKVLENNPEHKFTCQEIAEGIFEKYPDECRKKLEETTLESNEDLLKQIASEISSQRKALQKKYPEIKNIEKNIEGPSMKYYFSESADDTEMDSAENSSVSRVSPSSTKNGADYKEHELYPMLTDFLWAKHKIYSKRINESVSSNTKGRHGNKWLHPDLVGMEILSKVWEDAIKDCVQEYSDKKTKLWSFEVKCEIKRRNVREIFFQAVSNSTWANLGYVVARKLDTPDTMKEFRILASLHGIGLITLNVKNPSESDITIPAKERSEIDWNTANRLAEENKDFVKYINSISRFYQTKEVIHDTDWDKPTMGFAND